jgi:phosphoribosyl 1,2-cyclic phosphodiesterase
MFPGLTLRFRGTRGSIPTSGPEMIRYGGHTACVEIRSGTSMLVLDAGTGLRPLGADLIARAGKMPVDVDLLISHTHWDHIQGLPFFAPAYSAQNRVRIFTPPGKRGAIDQALRTQMTSAHFPVGFGAMCGVRGLWELSPSSNRIGSFNVTQLDLNHPGGCAGFRIEAGGASIAYLSDHEPYGQSRDDQARQAELISFIQGVDLLILDTQYTEEEYFNRVGWGHGSVPESVAIALEAKAGRLAFFHHDPSHTDSQIDSMVNDARRLVGAANLTVQAAADNDVIQVSPANVGMSLPVTPGQPYPPVL